MRHRPLTAALRPGATRVHATSRLRCAGEIASRTPCRVNDRGGNGISQPNNVSHGTKSANSRQPHAHGRRLVTSPSRHPWDTRQSRPARGEVSIVGRGIAEVIATARVRIVPRVGIRQLAWNADPETTANYRGILGNLRHLEREPTTDCRFHVEVTVSTRVSGRQVAVLPPAVDS